MKTLGLFEYFSKQTLSEYQRYLKNGVLTLPYWIWPKGHRCIGCVMGQFADVIHLGHQLTFTMIVQSAPRYSEVLICATISNFCHWC